MSRLLVAAIGLTIAVSAAHAAGTRMRLTANPATTRYPGADRAVAGEAELGRQLFFDRRLSAGDTMSCASCHQPEHGFSDGERFSRGVTGRPMARHTPHLYNLAWSRTFFWDGRAASLEEQVLGPLNSADELGLPADRAVRKLAEIPEYAEGFARVYRQGLTVHTLARAIAAFERTLVAADSPFDRFEAGDSTALSPAAQRGRALFFGAALCSRCHSGPDFTDGKFHNTGVEGTDPGRAAVERVGQFRDRPYPFFQMQRAFKTPGLRNVSLTAPYFHDGSEPTLDSVIRFYNQGGKAKDGAVSLDVRPLRLGDEAIADLLAFLASLSSPIDASLKGPEPGSNQER
jgi:cytochrome c peroxidase